MAADLAISSRAEARWRRLGPEVHDHVAMYLSGEVALGLPITLDAPAGFVEDLVRGAPGLRAAFPDLRRTLVAIRGTEQLVLTIVCEGTHAGTFFGFMLPTDRAVAFEEVHHLRFGATGALVEDRVEIDLSSIVRQLSHSAADAGARRSAAR